jgi:hypothetical protein
LHNLSSFDTTENQEQTFDMVFRESSPTAAKCLSPSVTKANPILGLNAQIDKPFPSTIEFEHEESDEIGGDWAMEDEDWGSTSADFPPIQTVTPLATSQRSSLYSFYFEDNQMETSEDDASVSLHDEISLDDADFCLDTIQDNPEAFWSSAPAITQERRSSSTQISLISDTLDELQTVDSL